MFESAELGHEVSKKEYEREVPRLREALLDAQFELSQRAGFQVILLIGGVDGAGKGETVNLLNDWMDPHHIHTVAFSDPDEQERERPYMWRFWRALPPKGKIGIFFGSWYTEPIVDRVMGHAKPADFDQRLQEIARFEKMLTDEGALVLKFWFHLSRERQKARLESLQKNPKTRWRVSETDWERFKKYDKFKKISEHALRLTSTAEAPWIVVEGMDSNYRNLTVGKTLLAALEEKLKESRLAKPANGFPLLPTIDNRHILGSLDLGLHLAKHAYEKQLDYYQGKLSQLSRHPGFEKRSVIAVFEGPDAAGKGGSIKKITSALDARKYQVIPVAAPTDEELAHPYLWRFWRHMPGHGRFTLFDRSWYGRVLVERVEKFCSEADWLRGYNEINDFEQQLVENGAFLFKFWIAISKEQQLARFEERQKIGFKRFKITEEDWRNREKWDDYETAVCDMVDRTSTDLAPWTLVEGNDKLYARIRILKTLCEKIEKEIS